MGIRDRIYGLAGEAQASLYDTDLKGNVALVLGGEADGMRRLTREHCDGLVKIPMPGDIESLNVSVAAGVTLFEAVRQRKYIRFSRLPCTSRNTEGRAREYSIRDFVGHACACLRGDAVVPAFGRTVAGARACS